MTERNIYLRIEGIEDYSPVEPQTKTAPPIEYKRDGMRNPGHETGVISDAERDQRAMRAVVYRQYRDPTHIFPVTSKIVAADVNEPVWSRRVPGCVLWAYVGETLKIHVHNADFRPHSFHVHGLRYGIDSDGAWPMGTVASPARAVGRRAARELPIRGAVRSGRPRSGVLASARHRAPRGGPRRLAPATS